MSLLHDMKADGAGLIELCTGQTRDGRDFYAFVRMTLDEYQRYREALQLGTVLNLGKFGEILHTGWGTEPDEKTRSRILHEHTDNEALLKEMATHLSAMQAIIHRNSEEGR